MITIDDPETERLARELAARRGESVQAAVRAALLDARAAAGVRGFEDQAYAHEGPPDRMGDGPLARTPEELEALLSRVRRIQDHVARFPVLDPRSADELQGYDEYGLPT